jgi:putative Holliday junction resolvase
VRGADHAADHARVAALVDEVSAERVVVGLPLSLDGSVGPAAARVLAEVEELIAALAVPVETWDERFSTVTAERGIKASGRRGGAKGRRQIVDAVAASVLLQGWLDRRRAKAAGS